MSTISEYASLTTVVNPPIFGFEYEDRWKNHHAYDKLYPEAINQFNLIRAVGYIPFIHVIVGIALIIFAVYLQIKIGGGGDNRFGAAALAIRGVLTITCGYWLLGADIAKYLLQENALRTHFDKAKQQNL